LSSSTAAAVTGARVLVSATPGGNATGRFAFAIAAPMRRIASAETRPSRDGVGTEAGELARERGRGDAELAAAAVRRVDRGARDRERDETSVPGFAGSHSSATLAVSSRRGPT
jgi:hypothetical protein